MRRNYLHDQRGSGLIISLFMLLIITGLGANAVISSNLQEQKVKYQKQSIAASLAAESGAAMAIRWLRAHPDAWGDEKAWKTSDGLPFDRPVAPNLNSSAIYWIESVRFNGERAVIVSRGGVWVAGEVLGQTAMTAILKNEDYGLSIARDANLQFDLTENDQVSHAEVIAETENLAKKQEIKIKIVAWRPVAMINQ